MNDRKKELTRKYFVEQKFTEIGWTVLVIGTIILLPLITTGIFYSVTPLSWHPNICTSYNTLNPWSSEGTENNTCTDYLRKLSVLSDLPILGQWGMGIILDIGLLIVGLIIGGWLKSNWEKAERKAEEELCKHKWKKGSYSTYCTKCGKGKHEYE